MLIKGIEKGGKAIPITPKEAIPHAVQYGVKSKNTSDTIFWVDPKTVAVSSFHHNTTDDGNWTAQVSGQAMIGHTDVATDQFHVGKLCNFSVKYRSGRDSFGIPDIVVDNFDYTKIETNPAKRIGPVDSTQAVPLATGELQAQPAPSGGKPARKLSKSE